MFEVIIAGFLGIILGASNLGDASFGEDDASPSSVKEVEGNPNYAREIFNSFNSFCPTNGSWTLSALGETRKLEKVLISMRDDKNCVLAAEAVSVHVDSLGLALDRIDHTWAQEKSILRLENQQMDILHLLETETDSAKVADLERIFRSNQLKLSLDKKGLQLDKEYARNEHLSSLIVQSTSKIYEQLALNQQCFLKSPQFLSSISAIGTSLGSALLPIGGSSLVLAASANILGGVMGYFRKSKINKSIQSLGQAEFISAHQCVLESLSNQWCQAKEAYNLIELKLQTHPEIEPDTFSRGVEIINRDLPVLVSWLRKVRSATLPANSSISSRQSVFLNSSNQLETWRLKTLGALGDAVERLPKNLLQPEDEATQFNVLQNFIIQVIPSRPPRNDPNAVRNPLYDITTPKQLAWLLSGIAPQHFPYRTDNNGNLTLQDISSFTARSFNEDPKLAGYYPLHVDRIRSSILKMYERALVKHSEQRTNVLNADPEFLFWDLENEFYSRNPGLGGLSPGTAISNILDYFKTQYGGLPSCHGLSDRQTSFGSNFDRIYAETQEILCRIKEQTQMVSISPNYHERLKEIFTVSRLHNGEVFLENRIQSIVRKSLSDYLAEQSELGLELPLQLKLQLVDDFIRELGQYNNSNLSQVQLDILNALQIFEGTMQNFAEIFSTSLGITIHQVYEKNKNNPLSKNLLSKYCSLLLSVPNWNSKTLQNVDLSVCEGHALKSIWGDREEFEFQFTHDKYLSPMSEDRICHFRRFLRKEQYRQDYRK